MERILITGSSGFIGTNLMNKLINKTDYKILGLDIASPRIEEHNNFFKKVDINDYEKLYDEFNEFKPDYVIHLAARTDLRGNSLDSYSANILGVKNLLKVLSSCNNLKKVLFTSSMYVCVPGYTPLSFEDYNPHTIYGESKVETEKIIKSHKHNYSWSILRPTSIWGPWFGEPYKDFFEIVLGRKFFHMGSKACKKTYGYVENTMEQIMKILLAENTKTDKKVYYLGDSAYDISEWADEIAQEEDINIPKIPFFIFKILALIGDLLKFFKIKFPMTSFRLKNMTTDNVYDLSPVYDICNELKVSRKEGIKTTLKWMKK